MVAAVYKFTDDCEDKMLLGNKGANLVTMTKIGLRVPPGFVLSIEAYAEYRRSGRLPIEDIEEGLRWLEQAAGKKMGGGLMVSVRSSAPVSMPGMMDTMLNIRSKQHMISAIKKIFGSWDNLRAVEYRRLNRIPRDIGTAAIVQAMVMGDVDDRSGTGVVFTRNASTGDPELFGEYIGRAQGEDLVSGVRTPAPISELQEAMPEMYSELQGVARKLEEHFKDMQDVEFTIESGTLYILQTRAGKRSGQAAVRIAVDMAKENLISQEDALRRVKPEELKALLHKRIKSTNKHEPLAHGLNAAPGAASGKVVFHPTEAMRLAEKSEKVILVRPETSPDDIQGIAASDGVLTSRGGLTSHAAIVTRAMGKPCICGAETIKIDLKAERFEVNSQVVTKGMEITIDGTSGTVYLGALPLEEVEVTPELNELLCWADTHRRLGVRANADTAEMIRTAKAFGCEGIGLCRTERQFNAPERLSAIREYIMARTEGERMASLEILRRYQVEDFEAIFRELDGLPIIIRLLDLPLHEFLPSESESSAPSVQEMVRELREVNPMIGHRGVRLGVTNPEIYRMQVEAIVQAKAALEGKMKVDVSVMIPQVITVQELLWVKKHVKAAGLKVGVMMETVRACMRAGKLAHEADFFSFGTNDLTQAVYSFSREDAEKKFLATYLGLGILQDNPFEIVDVKGVGRLMETAIMWARRNKKGIQIGVCGEHGGEARSIRYFHVIGIDYVSCSAFRIPVARLVAAQAAIEEKCEAQTPVLDTA